MQRALGDVVVPNSRVPPTRGWAVIGPGSTGARFTRLHWQPALGASERSAASRGWRLGPAARCTILRGCPLTTLDRRRGEPNVPTLDCQARRSLRQAPIHNLVHVIPEVEARFSSSSPRSLERRSSCSFGGEKGHAVRETVHERTQSFTHGKKPFAAHSRGSRRPVLMPIRRHGRSRACGAPGRRAFAP